MRIVDYVLIVWVLAVFVLAPRASAQSYKQSYALSEASIATFLAGESNEGLVPSDSSYAYFVLRAVPTELIPLPVPVDPSDMLMQEAINVSDFGAGYGITSGTDAEDSLAVFRIVPNVKLDATYDTGNPDAKLSPSSFALQGSDKGRASGKFGMQTSTAKLLTDVQFPSITAQLFVKIQEVDANKLDFSQVYARWGNLLGGKYFSSFSDSGTLPQTIVPDASPAGASVKSDVVQLQYARLFTSGVLITAAIENPITDDFTLVSTTDARLQRMPDVVGRIRYQPLDAWNSLQGAILFRQFAYEDIGRQEHSTSAISYSGNARSKTFSNNNVRLGVIGGEGSGSRIFGLNAADSAAGPNVGRLEALQNVGAFASYQHYWAERLWSNVAYGYAFADVTQTMTEATRRSQNGWVNMIWNNSTGNIAIGVEYQVGQQEVGNGAHGLNHHIQLSLQIGKRYVAPTATTGTTGLQTAGINDFFAEPNTAPFDRAQAYPRL